MMKKKLLFISVLFTITILPLFSGQNSKLNLKLELGGYHSFYGLVGVELQAFKFIWLQGGVGTTPNGAVIYSYGGAFKFRSPKKITPFFTFGGFGFSFSGNDSHDKDAEHWLTFGSGVEIALKKKKQALSLGFKIILGEYNSAPLFYASYIWGF